MSQYTHNKNTYTYMDDSTGNISEDINHKNTVVFEPRILIGWYNSRVRKTV